MTEYVHQIPEWRSFRIYVSPLDTIIFCLIIGHDNKRIYE